MEKNATDYSKDTERYSQWRMLKARQIGEYLKLALPPMTKNAPKVKIKEFAAPAMLWLAFWPGAIALFFTFFMLISKFAYEPVFLGSIAWAVTGLALLIPLIVFFAKDMPNVIKFKKEQKLLRKQIKAINLEEVKQQFALLGEQADALAIELGVDPKALEALHGKVSTKTSADSLSYYRESIANISTEYDMVYQAYIKDRPDPFIDAGLATSPEGAKKKQADFMGFAEMLNRIEGREGYTGMDYLERGDATHTEFLKHHKELSVIK